MSPFPAHLTPRRAGLQAAAVLAIFYGYLYGNAWLAGPGGGGGRPGNLVLSVFITGTTMLLAVALFTARDAEWKRSLGLQQKSWLDTLLFGGVAIAASYGANIVAVGAYLAIAGDVKKILLEKAQWTSKMGELPFAWVLPIALFVGLWEEIVFRGFLLGRFRAAFSSKPDAVKRFTPPDLAAVALQAICFGLGHGYQGVMGFVQTGMVGLAFGLIAVWRKSIWPVVFAHLSIDAFGLFALRVLKPKLEEVISRLGSG